jgi:hypothetical protein
MRAQVTRVLRHMDAQVNGGGAEAEDAEEAEGGEQAEQQQATAADATAAAAAVALPPRPADLPADAPSSARAPLELLAAFIESTIVGRQYHRGSGERHVAMIPTYPSFDGRPLAQASPASSDAAAPLPESELSAAAREASRREDDGMWRDFRARLLHNLGVSGPGLWDVRGRARPQRPAEGWSMVVHPVGARRQQQEQEEQGGRGERGARRRALDPRAGPGAPAGAAPYVAEPGGALRPLRGDEVVLERRRTPKRRRRWPL